MTEKLHVTPNDDFTRVVIHVPREDYLNVDAAGLDQLIRTLANLRTQMRPPHPSDANNAQSPTWIDADIAYIDGAERDDLMFYTPEFGWLRFRIGELQRQEIAKRLLHQSQPKSGSGHAH